MKPGEGDPITNAVELFAAAREQADTVWRQTIEEGGKQPTLPELQMKALICGLEATSLLLQELQVFPSGVPEQSEPEKPRNRRQDVNRRQKAILSSSEAAEFLGVSLATVRRYSDAGILPVSITPGRQRRFDPNDLELFMHSQRRTY